MTPVLKFILLVLSILCLLVATAMGFGEGWLGIDDTTDYTGWLALGLVFFVGAHLDR